MKFDFTKDELKMIFHVFGNTVGSSGLRDSIFEKAKIELYGCCGHPVSEDLDVSSGYIRLSDLDIKDL